LSSLFLNSYLKTLAQDYPSASQFPDLAERFKLLISEQIVPLPKSLWPRLVKIVNDLHLAAHSDEFVRLVQQRATPSELEILNAKTTNASVLMAYDFHYSPETDRLSLIEINTNASSYLVSDILYRIAPSPTPDPWGNPIENLKEAFHSELSSFRPIHNPRVAIMDENIETQKMRVEFSMFSDLMKTWGWRPEILEVKDIQPQNYDFIYNRHTDFIFEKSPHLKEAFLGRHSCFSPHPREYLLMAAKDRLQDFASTNVAPEAISPITIISKDTPLEDLWARRKQLFFKPLRSFGAKGAYRGASVSRSHFAKLTEEGYLAQEFSPPGTLGEWKFDLRFYAYKNQIHLGVARVYKGQVTNMSTLGGGLARVQFVS
jgi:hypothetical protein